MLDFCQQIRIYTSDISKSEFIENRLIYDATIRNLEIIGEAATHIPPKIRDEIPEVEWRRVVGLRNILIHAYPTINTNVLWDIIQFRVPELQRQLEAFLSDDIA